MSDSFCKQKNTSLTPEKESYKSQKCQDTEKNNHPKAASNAQSIQKILLVEDDALVRIVHRNFFEELGCVIDIACNGKEALEFLDKHYTLIFMDMGLPDMLGIEVTKEFKKRNPNVPIIALTGYSSETSKQEFLNSGVDEIIIKPVFFEQLEKILVHYIPEYSKPVK
jgi:CheY-like chemotaxis protein